MRRSLLLVGLALVASGCQFGDGTSSKSGTSSESGTREARVIFPADIRSGRASYSNGIAACRRAQRTDALHFAPGPGEDRQLHARRYLDRMRSIVRANLKQGNYFGIALQGCIKAAWPKGVAVPTRSLRTLVGGEKLSFPPGVVRRGEQLICISNGIRVRAVVPPTGRSITGHGSPEIVITMRANGTVLAECR
jgi:hypothetical protein